MIIDSSAFHYTFNNEKWFTRKYNLKILYCTSSVNGGDVTSAIGGNIYIDIKQLDRSYSSINIINVMLSKTSPVNILSLGQLRKAGAVVDSLNNKQAYPLGWPQTQQDTLVQWGRSTDNN